MKLSWPNTFAGLSALAALAIAGCATGEAPRQPAQARTPAQPVRPATRPPVPAPSAAEYVAVASSIDLFEVRSAELALLRARNERLRDFARMMISAHQGTAAQLSFAGRRLNLLPRASLLPEHDAMMRELIAAVDFDATYRRQQIAIHEAALRLHGSFAASGQSPTLRPVASAAAPIARQHLEILAAIR
ncbi:MAG TPA: DUF4142 domain-containing protein [Sphingomicrobium sp.]|nr:DUF4142 domain-containing protein [Sphingomicrobium sp.]